MVVTDTAFLLNESPDGGAVFLGETETVDFVDCDLGFGGGDNTEDDIATPAGPFSYGGGVSVSCDGTGCR